MANSYSPVDKRLKNPSLTLGASVSQAVSNQISLTYAGSLHLRVDVIASSVTAGAGITLKLQHRSGDFEAWADLAGANASIAVTADGSYSMTQLIERSADQPNMPIKKMVQVVATTGAGSAITIDEVRVSQGM